MSPGAKKALIGGSVTLFVLLGACIACGFGGYASLSDWATGLKAQGERISAEADQFAVGKDSNACVDEGLRRDGLCEPTGVTCLAEGGVFMERCLDRAAPTPGFCDGVPPQTEIMRSAQWAVDRCTALGRPGQPCTNLMQGIQRHCARAATAAP